MSDMKEAKEQVTNSQVGGFGWGIRQALFGKKEDQKEISGDKKEGSAT